MSVDPPPSLQEEEEEEEEEYLLGAKGASALRHLLSKSGNPAAGISQFQKEHTVKVVQLDPLLGYFDQLGVTRYELHSSIMHALRDRLIHRIQHLQSNQM
jgi:hypothetical protein